MCTAVSYKNGAHYFGRNLDLEYSYDESVTVTPRNYNFSFRRVTDIKSHYAMIGMAYVRDGYPLYYDATNEMGLSMAGLSFWEYAKYKEEVSGLDNIAPFELIPWVLSQCKDVDEARKLTERINIIDLDYSSELPLTPMHWIISDKENSLAVESVADGLRVYENPLGILTNSPTFDHQRTNLNNYMGLSAKPIKNTFSESADLRSCSRGMGTVGLPGDFTSSSRFVRAAYVKGNSKSGTSEAENVSQFFHILDSVAHPRGSVEISDGKYEITVYSSCCNTEKGVYYYTTYENRGITAVDMWCEDLESEALVSYPLLTQMQVHRQN